MIIDVEGVGQVEFPDDATQDEINELLNAQYPQGRQPFTRPALADAAVGLLRGAAKVPIGLVRLAGESADFVRRQIPDAPGMRVSDIGGNQSALTTLAEGANALVDKYLPRSDSAGFWTGDVTEGVGQFAPIAGLSSLVARGAARGLTGAAAAAAATTAATSTAGALGFGMEFESAFTRELDRQSAAGESKDPDKAFFKAIPYAAGASVIEAKLGAGRVAAGLERLLAGEAGKELLARGVSPNALRYVAGSTAKEAGVGALQEAGQRALEDVIVDGKLDPAGIGKEAGVGAFVQGLLRVPVAAAGVSSMRAEAGRNALANSMAEGRESAESTRLNEQMAEGRRQLAEAMAAGRLTSEDEQRLEQLSVGDAALADQIAAAREEALLIRQSEQLSAPTTATPDQAALDAALGRSGMRDALGASSETTLSTAADPNAFSPVDQFITDTLTTRAASNKRPSRLDAVIVEPGTDVAPTRRSGLRSTMSLEPSAVSEEQRVASMTPLQRREYDAMLRAATEARSAEDKADKLEKTSPSSMASRMLQRSGQSGSSFVQRLNSGGSVPAEVIQAEPEGVIGNEGTKEGRQEELLTQATEAPTAAPSGLAVGAEVKYQYTTERKLRSKGGAERVSGTAFGKVVGFAPSGDPVIEITRDASTKPKHAIGQKLVVAAGNVQPTSPALVQWAKSKASQGPNAFMRFGLNANQGSVTPAQVQQLISSGFKDGVAWMFSEAQAAKLIYDKAGPDSDVAIEFIAANMQRSAEVNARGSEVLAKRKDAWEKKRAKRRMRSTAMADEATVAAPPTEDPETGIMLGATQQQPAQPAHDAAIEWSADAKQMADALGATIEANELLNRPAQVTVDSGGNITIAVNPGLMASLPRQMQDDIISEELIHAASFRAIQTKWDQSIPLLDYISKEFSEVWRSLPATTQDAIRARYGTGSDIELGGEVVRQLVQQARTGRITEDSLGEAANPVRSLFRRILDWIKQKLSGDLANRLAAETSAVLEALGESTTANEVPGVATGEAVTLGATKFIRDQRQLNEVIARGGTVDPSVMQAKAAAQVGAVPAIHITRMTELAARPTTPLDQRPVTAEPYSRRREVTAARIVNRVRTALTLTDAPIDFRSLSERERNGAAYMMLTLHQHIKSVRDGAVAKATLLLRKQAAQRGDMLRVSDDLAMREMFNAQAGHLANRYRSYIDHIRRTAPASSNLAALAQRIAKRAQSEIDGSIFSLGHIQNVIQWMAAQPGITVGPNSSARSIVEQARAMGGYRPAGTTEVDAYVALVEGFRDGSAAPGNVSIEPVLYQVEQLPEMIAAMRAVKDDAAKRKSEMTAFESSMGVFRGMVSPRKFADAYRRMRDTASGYLARARAADRSWSRVTDELLGTTDAVEVLDATLADPVYQRNITDAQAAIDLFVDPFESDPMGTGGATIRDPITKEAVLVGTSLTSESEKLNREKLGQLIANIETYVTDPETDPVMRNSYERALVRIKKEWMDASLAPEHNIYNVFGIGRLLKAVVPALLNPKNTAEFIGGRIARTMVQALNRLDLLSGKIMAIQKDAGFGVMRIQRVVMDAMASHQLTPSNPSDVATYIKRVATPLAASWQSDAQFHYRVGDTLPSGYVVTTQDMEWLQMESKFKNRIRRESETDAQGSNLPSFIEDQLGPDGPKVFRKSVSDGQYTMARGRSPDADNFYNLWRDTAAIKDPAKRLAARMDLLDPAANPDWWHDIVLSYLHDNSPDFKRMSAFEDKLRSLVRDGASGVVLRSWDDIADYIGKSVEEVRPTIISEIDAMVSDFAQHSLSRSRLDEKQAALAQPGSPGTDPSSEVMRIMASSLHNDGSFLNPRGKAYGSWGLYSYASVTANRLNAYSANATNIARARALERMLAVRLEIGSYVQRLQEQAKAWTLAGIKPEKKFAELQRLGQIRLTLAQAETIQKQWDSQTNNFKAWTERHAEEFDRSMLQAAHTMNQGVGVGLLQTPRSVKNNFISAALINPIMTDALVGGWTRILLSPFITAKTMAQMAMGRLTEVAAKNPAFRSWLHQNKGLMSSLLNANVEAMQRARRSSEIMRAAGINTPYDWDNTRKFMESYRGGGLFSSSRWAQALREKNLGSVFAPGVGGVETLNEESSFVLRSIRSLFNTWLPAMATRILPRKIDQGANVIVGMKWLGFLEEILSKAVTIGDTRDGGSPDPTDARHSITAAELGVTPQQLKFVRDLFHPVGGLETVMFDYYRRLKAAEPGAKSAVPLMPDDLMNSWMLGAMEQGNVIREGNSPPAFRAYGLVGRIASMFWSWPSNFIDQVDKLFASSPTLKGNMRGIPAIIAISMVALVAKEGFEDLIEMITGKTSGQQRLANVAQDPNAVDMARYAATTLGAMVPFVGGTVEWALGGSSSRPMFDATSHVPLIGFVADTTWAAANAVRSGDSRVMLDWANRWAPLYAIGLNRIPGVDEDLAARNATRALRASVPASMPTRQMGSGSSAPKLTPLSATLRSLESAAYAGDRDQASELFEQAVTQYAAEQGVAADDSARRSVVSIIRARTPTSKVFGRVVSSGELERVVARMSTSQRAAFDPSLRAYQLIGDVAGADIGMSRDPRKAKSGGRRLRGLLPSAPATGVSRLLRSALRG